jgi:hypothetical protein
MTNQHPITPPPELVQGWIARYEKHSWDPQIFADLLSCTAARWGADQELEACCEWLEQQTLCGHRDLIPSFRAARRPGPPTLKEQALEALERMHDTCLMTLDNNTIRRALEALPND